MSAKDAVQSQRQWRSGSVRIADVLRNQFRTYFGKRGFAEMRLITHWQEIVGKNFAAVTLPIKVSHSRKGLGGTLTVQVNGAVAPILQMHTPEIMRRINAYYGYTAIARITLTQTSSTYPGIPVRRDHDSDDGGNPTPEPLPTDVQRAIDDLEDDDLRRAMTALGEHVYTQDHDDKPDHSEKKGSRHD